MTRTLDDPIPSSSTMSMMSAKLNGYRDAREMPYRLRQAVAVHLDNKQYIEGFTLLHSLITAGLSNPHAPPVYTPTPSVFELAATLAVHPQFTTRAKSPEDLQAADDALRFLHVTTTVLGPVTAVLNHAFLFRPPGAASKLRKRKRRDLDIYGESQGGYGSTSHDGSGGSDYGSEDDGEGGGRLKNAFAGEKSVFRQRGCEVGFWSVVGWAFNCSVKHKKRWERWRLWLEVMIEVLEEDLGLRFVAMREEVEKGADPAVEMEKLVGMSLLGRYCERFGQARGKWKRVVRAVLAAGTDESLREFGEVWKNETKERKVKKDEWNEHRKKLDLENDEWGEFGMKGDEDEIEEGEDEEMPEMSAGTTKNEQDFGGPDAMKLRQRLMIQLLNLSNGLPGHFIYIEDLYDIFTEYLKPLPLPYFRDFFATLTPTEGSYPTPNHIALLVNTMLPFLAAPPNRPDIIGVTQEQLIKSYLPHAANATSLVENAKMSLLIDHLLFYMWTSSRLTPGPSLAAAVEKGIRARKNKAIGDARRKDKLGNADETAARVVLEMSAERIRMLVGMIGEKEDHEADGGVQGGEEAMESSSQLSELTQTPSLEDDEEDLAVTPT